MEQCRGPIVFHIFWVQKPLGFMQQGIIFMQSTLPNETHTRCISSMALEMMISCNKNNSSNQHTCICETEFLENIRVCESNSVHHQHFSRFPARSKYNQTSQTNYHGVQLTEYINNTNINFINSS